MGAATLLILLLTPVRLCSVAHSRSCSSLSTLTLRPTCSASVQTSSHSSCPLFIYLLARLLDQRRPSQAFRSVARVLSHLKKASSVRYRVSSMKMTISSYLTNPRALASTMVTLIYLSYVPEKTVKRQTFYTHPHTDSTRG